MRPWAANNFDLIRLFAALQVMCYHLRVHILKDPEPATFLDSAFPGVPIFFFVSGYLVSGAYERAGSVWQYLRNRALRIYPGLLACAVLTLGLVVLAGRWAEGMGPAVPVWLGAQLAIPCFTPAAFAGYGTGNLNGSLWTIPVELQFYVALIFLFRMRLSMAIFVAIAASLMNRLHLNTAPVVGLYQLNHLTLGPWLSLFLLGMGAWRLRDRVIPWVAGRFLPVLAGYVGLFFLARWWGWTEANAMSPVTYTCLGATILAAAYTAPGLSAKVLRGQDLSYGIYLYHMPVVNAGLACAMAGWWAAGVLGLGVLVLAAWSWFQVEKPSLALKGKRYGEA